VPSIEILVEGTTQLEELPGNFSFAISYDFPPMTHRNPSFWQDNFKKVGGTLVHIGNPDMKIEEDKAFFAYNLIDEDDHCKTFRIQKAFQKDLENLLRTLLDVSETNTIHFTIDWQLGPTKPYKYKRHFQLDKFLNKINKTGLRLNSWSTIK
jgi:hypothetical protein